MSSQTKKRRNMRLGHCLLVFSPPLGSIHVVILVNSALEACACKEAQRLRRTADISRRIPVWSCPTLYFMFYGLRGREEEADDKSFARFHLVRARSHLGTWPPWKIIIIISRVPLTTTRTLITRRPATTEPPVPVAAAEPDDRVDI